MIKKISPSRELKEKGSDKDLVGCLGNSLHYMCYLSVREDREVSQVH